MEGDACFIEGDACKMKDDMQWVFWQRNYKQACEFLKKFTLKFLLFLVELCNGLLGGQAAGEPRIDDSQKILTWNAHECYNIQIC